MGEAPCYGDTGRMQVAESVAFTGGIFAARTRKENTMGGKPDMGEWLKTRAKEAGREPARAPAERRTKADLWLGIASAVLGAAALLGTLVFPRYSPAHAALSLAVGAAAAFAGMGGLYLLVFAGLTGARTMLKLSLPLVVVGTVLGAATVATELFRRAEDAKAERANELVPDRVRARAHGWLGDK
jgi:hypothetical protein